MAFGDPRMNRRHVAVVVALLLSTAGTVHATPNSQVAQALFDEAKKLMAESDFAKACPKLAESQRLDPSGGTLLHLAICHEGEGKTATAWTELNEAISVARRDGRADRESAAKARLAALVPKLTKLTIVVGAEARAPGLEIAWNDIGIHEPQWGVAFPVDPGEHVITAVAPGRRKWSTRVTIAAGASPSPVTVPVLAVEAAVTPSPPPAAPAASGAVPATAEGPEASSGSSTRTVGLALTGVGAVGLAVGAAFFIRTGSLVSERDEAASEGDREGRDDKHESAKSSQVAALVAGSIGVAALGTGLLLFLTAPKKGVALAPLVSPTAGGLLFSGSL
jgi:hypothetical protein